MDETEVRKRRGYWLKLARERIDMDQADAAVVAGLSPLSARTVSEWEHGRGRLEVDQLRRLADAYGIPVDFFMNGMPDTTDPEILERVARRP